MGGDADAEKGGTKTKQQLEHTSLYQNTRTRIPRMAIGQELVLTFDQSPFLVART